MHNIWVVEDDDTLATVITDILTTKGYIVQGFIDGSTLVTLLSKSSPDLIILDVMLPKKNGFEIAKEIKQIASSVPIIFLSSKSEHEDIIKGFESGGCDYVKKPFHFEELLARITIHLERTHKLESKNSVVVFQLGHMLFHYSQLQLSLNNTKIKLSSKETEVLKVLYDCLGENVSKYDLMETVWGETSTSINKLLDVYITKLRQHLKVDESVQILNIRGYGYKLVTTLSN